MRKNDAFVAKIVNTRLTKIFMAIFAPDERLPSSATLVCIGVVDGHRSGQVPAFTTILENLFPSMSTSETQNQIQAQNTAVSKRRTFACWHSSISCIQVHQIG